MIKEKELDHSEEWFRKYGQIIVFSSRLLPVIRTFISLPAGIAKMNLSLFIVYTVLGSFIWSLILTYVGFILGNNWRSIEIYFHKFDLLIVSVGLLLIGVYIYRKIKKQRGEA